MGVIKECQPVENAGFFCFRFAKQTIEMLRVANSPDSAEMTVIDTNELSYTGSWRNVSG
jgi:hypothetical protein